MRTLNETQAWQLVTENTDVWPMPQRTQPSSFGTKEGSWPLSSLRISQPISHVSVLILRPCLKLIIILDPINLDWLLIRFAFGFYEPNKNNPAFYVLASGQLSLPRSWNALSLWCFGTLPSVPLCKSFQVRLTGGASSGTGMILLFSLSSRF